MDAKEYVWSDPDYPIKAVNLIKVGDRVRCSSHVGRLVAYFVGQSDLTADTNLYGVIELEEGYWTEGRKTFVRMLVVHSSNIGPA